MQNRPWRSSGSRDFPTSLIRFHPTELFLQPTPIPSNPPPTGTPSPRISTSTANPSFGPVGPSPDQFDRHPSPVRRPRIIRCRSRLEHPDVSGGITPLKPTASSSPCTIFVRLNPGPDLRRGIRHEWDKYKKHQHLHESSGNHSPRPSPQRSHGHPDDPRQRRLLDYPHNRGTLGVSCNGRHQRPLQRPAADFNEFLVSAGFNVPILSWPLSLASTNRLTWAARPCCFLSGDQLIDAPANPAGSLMDDPSAMVA